METAVARQAYFDAVLANDLTALSTLLRATKPDDRAPIAETLYEAICRGRADAVQVFLDAGVHPDIKTDGDRTPLMVAAEKGAEIIARQLLEAGAEVNEYDINRWTALHYGASFQHLAIVKLLIASGANPRQRDAFGKSALDVARELRFKLKIPFISEGGGVRRSLRDTAVAKYLKHIAS